MTKKNMTLFSILAGILITSQLTASAHPSSECKIFYQKEIKIIKSNSFEQKTLSEGLLIKLKRHFEEESNKSGWSFFGSRRKTLKKIVEKIENANKNLMHGLNSKEDINLYEIFGDLVHDLNQSDAREIVKITSRSLNDGLILSDPLRSLLQKISYEFAEVRQSINEIFFTQRSKVVNLSQAENNPFKKLEKYKFDESYYKKYEEDQNESATKLLEYLSQQAKSGSNLVKSIIDDYINYSFIRKLISHSKVKALSIGYDLKSNEEQFEHQLELVKKLLEVNDVLIIDGDSPLANRIAEIDSKKIIFVTSAHKSSYGKNSVVIENDYLRLLVFNDSKYMIATPDSPLGMSVVLNDGNVVIFDPSGKWKNGFSEWSRNVNRDSVNLGLSFYDAVKRAKEIEQVIENTSGRSWDNGFVSILGRRADKNDERVKIDNSSASLEKLDLISLNELSSLVKTAEENHKKLEYTEGQKVPGGAVVFGSSQNHWRFTKLIWDITYFLASKGVPISTGGSGGYMEVANDAAFSAGTESIGIPLGRGAKSFLKNEQKFATKVQTKTISTSGYMQRIPYLLHRKKMVLFVPGGKGTAKELATTMFKFTKNINSDEIIVFVGAEYYRELYNYFKMSPMPEEIKSRVHLVDNVDEMNSLFVKYEDQLIDKEELRTNTAPIARNNFTSFQGQEYRTEEKRQVFGGDSFSPSFRSEYSNSSLKTKSKAQEDKNEYPNKINESPGLLRSFLDFMAGDE